MTIGQGLSSLQSVDLSYCRKLTDKGLVVLAEGCPDLRALRLAGCRFVSSGSLQALSKNCPDLEELCLHGCVNVNDDGLSDLVTGCRRITSLDLNKCVNVGDRGVASISEASASSLRTLKILDCYKVGDESVLSLARFCARLETLVIGGCRNVTDESILSLANSPCKDGLRILRMDWCLNVSDASLSAVLARCRSLEALDIGCCEEITDAAFLGPSSREGELNLKVLKASNCPKITVAGIARLLEDCKSLEYLDLRSCPRATKACCDEAGLVFPDSCKVNFTGSLSEPDVLL